MDETLENEAEEITSWLIVRRLNEVLEQDREGVDNLFGCAVTCSEALAQHPTVQVQDSNNGYVLSTLGILNGIAGTVKNGPNKGRGRVTAVYSEDTADECGRLLRFEMTE